jgi:hypothetical protein
VVIHKGGLGGDTRARTFYFVPTAKKKIHSNLHLFCENMKVALVLEDLLTSFEKWSKHWSEMIDIKS